MRLAPALCLALAVAATGRPAAAQTVVASCAPETVVAAATGARKALLARARTFHDWAANYDRGSCLDLGTGQVAPRVGACGAPAWWRTDCSGFVSSAWSLSQSLTTPEFGDGGTDPDGAWVQKSWDALEPGDAIIAPGFHMALFTGWLDAAETSFCVLEDIHPGYSDPWGGLGCIADAHDVGAYKAEGFFPIGLLGLDGGLDGGVDGGVDGGIDGGSEAGVRIPQDGGAGLGERLGLRSGGANGGPAGSTHASSPWLLGALVVAGGLGARRRVRQAWGR